MFVFHRPAPTLRTLDALNLACVIESGPMTRLVAYDDRLLAAASSLGVAVLSPT